MIVLFAQSPFDKMLGASNIKDYRYEWIWEKNVATGHLNAKRQPMKKHENILVFYKKAPLYVPQMTEGEPYINKRNNIYEKSGGNYDPLVRTDTVNKGERYPTSILRFDREIGFHPTQKPVPLLQYLIRTYTEEDGNELVLDNTMGSGSTIIACLNENKQYIGIELDENHFNTAKERIELHKEILIK